MSIDRPTFSENWYRMEQLRPRLRASIRTFRQAYRGRLWHVVRDESNNQFFRLDDSAFYLVGLLDGKRTVAQAWHIANEKLGDDAPTQGETIQLLGQLYVANLLQADLAPDAAGVFERHRKRVRREMTGHLMNFLFPRFPLFNPNRMLERWHPAMGWIFSRFAFVLWVILLGLGGWFIVGRMADIGLESQQVLDPSIESLGLLYLAFVVIKAVHEFGHAMACKHFGLQQGGDGGDVPTIGIMLLVFVPCPYVDASASWAFRNKWHRAIVGAAGMYVELALAAVAAMVWANTTTASWQHLLAFRAMLIASVSTVLFNGNPLLRYDAYYIVSDLLEIPNLGQRSKDYLYYLVKRYFFGATKAVGPLAGPGERYWLVIYAIASGIYRVIVSVGIIMFISDKLFKLGLILAIGSVIGWIFVPIGKFFQYLFTSPELERVRVRAVGASLAVIALIFLIIGVIPWTDHQRAQGLVEIWPEYFHPINMPADGFIDDVLPTGTLVRKDQLLPDGRGMVTAHSDKINSEIESLEANRRLYLIRAGQALQDQPAMQQASQSRIESVEKRLDHLRSQAQALHFAPPIDGVWISPAYDRLPGAWVAQGQSLGLVADFDKLRIRVVMDQNLGPRIEAEVGVGAVVEIRMEGRPEQVFQGRVEKIGPGAQTQLPSEALGFRAGGMMPVKPDDKNGRNTSEGFFEVLIQPDPSVDPRELWTGQRVMVRFNLPKSALAVQWYRSLSQLLQRRFQI